MSPFTQKIVRQLSSRPHKPPFIIAFRSFLTSSFVKLPQVTITTSTLPQRTRSHDDTIMTSRSARIGNHHHYQKRSMFIQTVSTPNPESIKFLPGRAVLEISDGGSNGFYATRTDKDEIARSPLSKRLFQIDGIKSVYLGEDFVTVTKFAEANWAHIKTVVFSEIMDHYQSGKPAVTDVPEITDTTIFEDDDEVVAMIKELLETKIRPAVQEDGGDIRYFGFDEETGMVSVQLAGSCVGCPSSSVTLKNGVENMLMHYIPEVTGVESVEEEEDDDYDEGESVVVESTKGNNVTLD